MELLIRNQLETLLSFEQNCSMLPNWLRGKIAIISTGNGQNPSIKKEHVQTFLWKGNGTLYSTMIHHRSMYSGASMASESVEKVGGLIFFFF